MYADDVVEPTEAPLTEKERKRREQLESIGISDPSGLPPGAGPQYGQPPEDPTPSPADASYAQDGPKPPPMGLPPMAQGEPQQGEPSTPQPQGTPQQGPTPMDAPPSQPPQQMQTQGAAPPALSIPGQPLPSGLIPRGPVSAPAPGWNPAPVNPVTPPFLGGGRTAPLAPVPQKGGILRAIGGSLAGRFLGPGIQSDIEHPGYKDAMQKYQAQLKQQMDQGAMDKTAAETAHAAGQGNLVNAQAKDLAEQGKKPYITVPGGGVFNTRTGTWVRQPVDKSQLIALTPETGTSLGIAPLADGTYAIPAAATGDLIKSQMDKPVKTLQEVASKIVMDDSLSPQQKQAKLEEIKNAYNIFNGDKPVIHWAEGKDGTITAVTATPGGVAAAGGAKSFGQIGKPQAPQMPGINLTPEAVQFWGQAAGQGVPLPSMGMGAGGAHAREQIINAAPGAAGGSPLAANRAVQRADTTSLGSMTKMRDGVVAFENTAKANLDVFVNLAQKAVDSGSPWVNTPLRSVNRNGLGSTDLAAFDAARQVALTEIAKVVNNPSLSSVLSDSARKEVTSLIPENATLKQIYSVVKVLNLDMQNRHKYLDQGIADINKRMGGRQANSPDEGHGIPDLGSTFNGGKVTKVTKIQ